MKRYIALMLAACMVIVLVLSSCSGSSSTTEEESVVTTATTVPTMAPIVEDDLGNMLTMEEISAAVGLPMQEPAVSGQGSMMTCLGDGNHAYLSIMISEKPIEIFNEMLSIYTDAIPCPNLGESSWYSPVSCQLLTYGNGYMISVELTGTEDSDMSMQMLRCRQLTALLLEHL